MPGPTIPTRNTIRTEGRKDAKEFFVFAISATFCSNPPLPPQEDDTDKNQDSNRRVRRTRRNSSAWRSLRPSVQILPPRPGAAGFHRAVLLAYAAGFQVRPPRLICGHGN